jgi:hypothetical protein
MRERERENGPLERQRIRMVLCSSGRERESRVGAKNIASSSGWAMRRRMDLWETVGEEDDMWAA